MQQVTVGSYLATRLQQIGLKDYFAIPGDFNLTLLDEMLLNKNLRMINCCNELNAGYAADGYARAHGCAALLLTFSVGGLSAINAVAGAYAEDLPVIAVSGGPNTLTAGTQPILHHTLGLRDYTYVRDMYARVTARSVIVNDPLEAPMQIDEAIRCALKLRKPVYIEIACNISNAKVSPPHACDLFPQDRSDPAMLKAAVEHVAGFLNRAVKPVLVAGGRLRAWQGGAALEALAKKSRYAVACLPDAKGFFPEDHPNFAGIYWGSVSSPGCGELVESSDAYLFLGPRFTDYTTVGYTALINPHKLVLATPTFVQLEGMTYDHVYLPDLMQGLAERLTPNETALSIYRRIQGRAAPPPAGDLKGPLTTRRLFANIQELVDGHTNVVAETGDSWFNGLGLSLPKGAVYEAQMQYGSIGWSVGALLGCAAATPKRRSIALIGDGSFQMTAQEISTLIRYNIPAIVFLINNASYAIEVQIHDGPYNVIQNWHYAKLMDVFNRDGQKGLGFLVKNEKELVDAIAKAKEHKGLSFIEVIIDKDDCNKLLLEWGTRVASYNGRLPQPVTQIYQWGS